MPTEFCTYTLLGEISRGATSVVCRARDSKGRIVALKMLARHLRNDAAARARFMVEPAQQPSGPHIVRMLDSGVCNGAPYFAMELIEGQSFADMIRQARGSGGAVAPEAADRVLHDIAVALDAAHKQGIVHRDIKPSNMLIRARDQQAFLMDFGLAQSLAKHGVSVQATVQLSGGTADYIAPEQIQGGMVTPQADIYSLAVCIYEALAGRLPFTAEIEVVQLYQRLTESPPDLSDVNPRISPELSSIVMQALQKDPAARYTSAGEFARRFHGALTGTAAPAANRSMFAIAGGAAVLVIAAIAVAVVAAGAPAGRLATTTPLPTSAINSRKPANPTAPDTPTVTPAPVPTAPPPAQATSTLAPLDTPAAIMSDTMSDSASGNQGIVIMPSPLGIERWGKPTSPDGCGGFDDQHPLTRYEVMLTISNTTGLPLSNWKVDLYGGHGGMLPKCIQSGAEGGPIASGSAGAVKYDVYLESDVLARIAFMSSVLNEQWCVDGKALTPCR